ncbi:MATH domain and coiled-coil domain-containing protein At3g58440 isoform X3 [Eutrema salsugineum]|uniref:MATH domain and coiled-coil domain-containing protein At3g58440 isoform X3 n=1 Tax=Eutrema salsugineum TaxID=72664 RepID=UPI000CED677C|nr:MATH domain and coiled-coil domain-containing protein At3g58440 isoform X3 [Eutrema salsugineum]
MRMTLLKFQKRFGLAKMEGKAYVGGVLVCEGEFKMVSTVERFHWILESLCASDGETYYSRNFVVAGCNWRLKAYVSEEDGNDDEYLALYLELAPGSPPPGWKRQVRATFTLVDNYEFMNKVRGQE